MTRLLTFRCKLEYHGRVNASASIRWRARLRPLTRAFCTQTHLCVNNSKVVREQIEIPPRIVSGVGLGSAGGGGGG